MPFWRSFQGFSGSVSIVVEVKTAPLETFESYRTEFSEFSEYMFFFMEASKDYVIQFFK
jgi:hypothetical protein